MERPSKSFWSIKSVGKPSARDCNLRKRKGSDPFVPPLKLINSSLVSPSGSQIVLGAQLFKELTKSDSLNCAPSEIITISPSPSNESVPQLNKPSYASTGNSQNMDITQDIQGRKSPFAQFVLLNRGILFGPASTKEPEFVDLVQEEEYEDNFVKPEVIPVRNVAEDILYSNELFVEDYEKNPSPKPEINLDVNLGMEPEISPQISVAEEILYSMEYFEEEDQEGNDEEENAYNSSNTSPVEQDSQDSDYTSSEESEAPATSAQVEPKKEIERIWRLFRHYGRKVLKSMGNENYHSVKDYIDKILCLINSDETTEEWYFVNDYQIVTSDGKLWFDGELENIAEANMLKTQDDKAFCRYEECEECYYKDTPGSKEKVIKHFFRCTGALYYCVPCGEVCTHRYGIRYHVEFCPCRFIMKKHYDVELESWKPRTSGERPLKLGKVWIDDLQPRNHITEFIEFVEQLLTNIQRDGLLLDKRADELIVALKENLDNEFLCILEKIKMKSLSAKQFKIGSMDNFYTIVYPTNNQPDESKSVMFRIIEVATRKIRNIHRLKKVKEQTLSFGDMRCHYQYCKCKERYENPDPDYLIGHILAENFLIACVGCGTGFIDFTDFEKHFTDACYVKRKPFSQKFRKVM